MTNGNLIQELTSFSEGLVEIRHKIHRTPETAYEELETADLIATSLASWGIEVTTGLGVTGVVGTLRGNLGPGPSIGLRSDMDALHIDEFSQNDYRSTVPGKMHACGHDGHIAMLLGAARYLAGHRDFSGTVHFIFQPAEEGRAGARAMIENGLFERFPVERVYGMHNMPGIPAGEFRTRAGPFLAASDTWSVVFRGTGGHGGAGAHNATDVTLAQAAFVLALQTIVSRNLPPVETGVISIGHIEGGKAGSPNIIPSEITVSGTARSYDPDVRDIIERRLTEIATAQAAVFGCSADVRYSRIYPPLVTTAEETAIASVAASALVGAEKVRDDIPPLTISEDFAFMLEQKPGAFVLIGNGLATEGFTGLHTATYDFNDTILPIGAAYWVELVQTELSAR